MSWPVISLFGGIGGALFSLAVQWWRESRRKRRLATACRTLIRHELAMMWFDLSGTVNPVAARVFARQTEMWDTFKAQMPDLLTPEELDAVTSAYYWVKDLNYRIERGTADCYRETEQAMKCVEKALRLLGGSIGAEAPPAASA